MIRVICLAVLMMQTLSSIGQINVDSLWTVWADKTLSDTSRLNALDELTFQYYLRTKTDLDSTIHCCELMMDYAKEINSKKYEAIGLHYLGTVEQYKGNLDRSLELAEQSLAIRKETGDQKQIGRSLANIASNYLARGEMDEALRYYNDALSSFEKADDKPLCSFALNHIAHIYSQAGQLGMAAKLLSRSYALNQGESDLRYEVATLLNLADLYMKTEDLGKAKEYVELALNKSNENNYNDGVLQSNLILGNIFSREEDYMKAISISEMVLEEATDKDVKDLQFRNYAFTLMGFCYQEMGEYDKALKYYKEGINIGEELNLQSVSLTNAIELGHIYKLKKDGKNAVKWCEEALALAESSNNLIMQRESCHCLYESHKLLNNSTKALAYNERYLMLNDSLEKAEVNKKLLQMEFQNVMIQDSIAKAEEAKLIQEAHDKEVSQKNQTRNLLAAAGLLILILAGGIYSRLRYVRRSKARLQLEKDRSENLLLNILPADIAAELKEKGRADARDFDMVSILFTDFKGFTEASERLTAADLVDEINECFKAFDGIIEKHGIEKIKTIGDAYMAAGGLPVPSEDSVKNTILAALEMQAFISARKAKHDAEGKSGFEMRVGVHTGPVVAGIVGVKKFQYDVWGDTVNTASRIESNGDVGKVNVSQATYELLNSDPDFVFENRGKIEAKGKGEIEMYFVSLRNII